MGTKSRIMLQYQKCKKEGRAEDVRNIKTYNLIEISKSRRYL